VTWRQNDGGSIGNRGLWTAEPRIGIISTSTSFRWNLGERRTLGLAPMIWCHILAYELTGVGPMTALEPSIGSGCRGRNPRRRARPELRYGASAAAGMLKDPLTLTSPPSRYSASTVCSARVSNSMVASPKRFVHR
jgi:hypothetical protein